MKTEGEERAGGVGRGAASGGGGGGSMGASAGRAATGAAARQPPAAGQGSENGASAGASAAGVGSREAGVNQAGAAVSHARTSGLLVRRPTYKRVSGNVTEETELTLRDYIDYVKEVEGEAPEMDVVVESALLALFRRAKGFGPWRKDRLSTPVNDEEIEGALSQLVPTQGGGAGASGGASASG